MFVMAVNYTMKWKYSRFIVLIKTISSKSRFDLSPIKQQCQTVLFYVIWSFFTQLSSLFSTFLCLVSLFFFPPHLSASLSSLSFFTYNFYLLPFPSLVSALILCPLVFSNLLCLSSLTFFSYVISFTPVSFPLSHPSLLALHPLYFSSYSTCLCVFMETEGVTIPLMFPPW